MSETLSETPEDILPQLYTPAEDDMDDYRYRGYLYNLREPRQPLTGPIGFREVTKKYPLKSHCIKGKPVLPPVPGTGFLHGSPTVGQDSEKDRKEKKSHLKLLEKTSAELRKLQQQQHDRQKFMEEHRKMRDEEVRRKIKEKMEDLKLLQSYNPFGKPGFGAPRGSKKGNLAMTKALQSQDGVGLVKEEANEEPKKLELPPNRPRVQRYEDDRMRRYRVDRKTAAKYKEELDALVDAKKQRICLDEEIDKKREASMNDYDPFGKPGAGAPNIDEHGNVLMIRKQRIAMPEVQPAMEEPRDDNPWMKLGQPLPRIKKHLPRIGDQMLPDATDIDAEDGTLPRKRLGGGGDPLLDDSGSVITKRAGLLTTIHGARRTENINRVATPEAIRASVKEEPWGRPGAGAPLKDSQGEIVKNTKGRIKYESMGYTKDEEMNIERAKKIYRDDLRKGIEEQKHLRDEERNYMRLPPGDVPSWFSKGKVGRPKRDPLTGIIVPQKRIMSDVTAQKFNLDRPRDVEKYYRDLQNKADEKYKKRMEEKERLMKQDLKHIEVFNAMFCRPGHGAPHEKGLARRKFSNDSIVVQKQNGMKIPPNREKRTVGSALNLTKSNSPEGRIVEAKSSTSIRPTQVMKRPNGIIAEILAKEKVVMCEKCPFRKIICPLSLATMDSSSFCEKASGDEGDGESCKVSVSQAASERGAVKHEELEDLAVKAINQEQVH